MKKIKSLIMMVAMIAGLIVSYANNGNASVGKLYGFKSAEAIIKSTVPMGEITETVRISNWGQLESRHMITKMKIFGISRNEDQISYIDRKEGVVYNYNPKTKQTTKLKVNEFKDGMKESKMPDFSKEMIKKMNGKFGKKEKILGKMCNVVVFEDMNATVWLYKGFPLKMVNEVMGMKMVQEAISFKENISIAKKDITLPADAKIVDMGSIADVVDQKNAYMNQGGNPTQELNKQEIPQDINMPDLSNLQDAEGEMDMEEAQESIKNVMGVLQGIFGN